MIRFDAVLNERRLRGINEYIDGLPKVAVTLGEEAFQQLKPEMLNELRQVPGPVQYPIEWTSEKQRKAFFASDGFGRGIGAPRTNRMINAFDVHLDIIPGQGFKIVTTNDTDYFPFVVGRLRPRRLSERGWQQPFHINTGWQRIGRTIDRWQRKYTKHFKKVFSEQWERGH